MAIQFPSCSIPVPRRRSIYNIFQIGHIGSSLPFSRNYGSTNNFERGEFPGIWKEGSLSSVVIILRMDRASSRSPIHLLSGRKISRSFVARDESFFNYQRLNGW